MKMVGMSKLQQLDVFIGTNTKISRLILPAMKIMNSNLRVKMIGF